MSRQGDLDKLLSDLRSFLLILDRESLSAAARAKKKSVSDLLSRLQSPPSEDAEYMIMRCLSPSPGTPQGWTGPGSRTADAAGGRGRECRPASAPSLHGANKVLGGVSPSPPADDSYEDAEPQSGCSGGADTDSSHYESYEEEEEGVTDRAHYLRWPLGTSPEAEPPRAPRGPALRLPLEETLAGTVGKAALHRPGARAAVLQVCRRPAAGAGAGPAGLPCHLQGQERQEDATRPEGDRHSRRGAGHRLPEPAAG
ncbi:uncharacterized protein LOC113959699 isoform X2 [Corapipo altera]|uniref:uncharacterized protein LOC113959699 isoform X2 n=1 Tax=Corapipo altera TaxID=415028 RepID=UPI000FD62DBE|nr:uncharacterized protein LOC113959699 isoform X2 [Corapipo altera]